VWTGEVRFNDKVLLDPLKWKRPRKIFVCAHGDLFHENVPDEWIDRVFAVMALAPQHVFQVLTKRPERMRAYFADPLTETRVRLLRDLQRQTGGQIAELMSPLLPLPNVWLGVSVEDQQRADERIPVLLATRAAVRWLSCEPLLGPVDLEYVADDGTAEVHALSGEHVFSELPYGRRLDWVVAGGESGPGARPMHPDWARSLRDQCAAAKVPFLFKQWGEWEVSLDRESNDPDWRADYSNFYAESSKSQWLNLEGGRGFHGDRFHVMRRVGKSAAGRLLDGVQHDGYPASGLGQSTTLAEMQ
jgi:protein gp37